MARLEEKMTIPEDTRVDLVEEETTSADNGNTGSATMAVATSEKLTFEEDDKGRDTKAPVFKGRKEEGSNGAKHGKGLTDGDEGA